MRLGRTGTLVNMNAADVLGYSTALSSLGIVIEGHGELYADTPDLTPVVTLKDGTQPEFISSSVSTDGENIVYRMLFRTPVDTSQVAQLTLSGQPVVWN